MAIESPADSEARMDMQALWLALRRRWLRITLVTILLLAGAYALLLFVPKSYESTSSILVESRDSVYTRPASDTSSTSSLSPMDLGSLISSQIELVRSRDTLLAVVRSQKLTTVPEFNGTAHSSLDFLTRFLRKPSSENAEDLAVDALAAHLTVARERDSSLINVTVRSSDPNRAATLANAIAQADVSRRAGLSLSDTADASQWLDQQITQLRQRVAAADTKVADFKIANDLYTNANSTSLLDQQMAEVSTQITTAQERMSTAQSRATLIRGLLNAGQPIDSVDDVRNSVTIQQLMQQKAQLTAQRAQLLATLLPTHPTVQAVTAQITAVDRQIGLEGRRVADALEAEAKIEGTLLKSLQGNLDAIKAKEADATRQSVALDALNREASADHALLESYMTRYGDANARTDANSDLPDVRVVTLASPSSSPASPKTPMILGAVGFVALAVQIGAVLFGELLSGRALVEPGITVREEEAVREEADEAEFVAVAAELRPAVPVGGNAFDPEVEAAAEEIAAEDASTVEDTVQQERLPRLGLRSWFTRRARAVGESLTTFEPPMTLEPPPQLEAPIVAEDEAVEIAAEAMAPAVSPMDVDAEPEFATEAAAEFEPALDAANAQRLAELSADLILGRSRIVLVAALEDDRDGVWLGERLVADVLHRGLSVARVDAGSGRTSTELGITDLSTERASFGDVVHKTTEEGFAEVPWGHLTTMDRRSSRPITLVEALSDIYEVVVVSTGRIGMASSLPLFAGLSSRLVLATPVEPDPSRIDAARRDFAALGFGAVDVIPAPARRAEVA